MSVFGLTAGNHLVNKHRIVGITLTPNDALCEYQNFLTLNCYSWPVIQCSLELISNWIDRIVLYHHTRKSQFCWYLSPICWCCIEKQRLKPQIFWLLNHRLYCDTIKLTEFRIHSSLGQHNLDLCPPDSPQFTGLWDENSSSPHDNSIKITPIFTFLI